MIILAPAYDGRAILMLLSPYCNARHYFLRVAFYQESFSISKRILHFCKILILNLISHYPYKIF